VAAAARLRADLDVLPALAEAGLCRAAKDISMGGVIGTALMLLECSGLGATIDIRSVPAPENQPLPRWLLSTFPSFGFLLSAAERNVAAVIAQFASRDLSCAAIGRCDDTRVVRLQDGSREETAWDFADGPVIGCGPRLEAVR
jgi:selenophosphate synthetase-related protein